METKTRLATKEDFDGVLGNTRAVLEVLQNPSSDGGSSSGFLT